MQEPPKILDCNEVSDSRLFKVDRAELLFSNGERRHFEYLKAGEHGAVIIVPILDNGHVLLVEEYGVGLGRYELGLPKGKVDPGENFLEAANRELKEEAGYGANKLELLKCISQSPNYMQHTTHIVLARELYEEKLVGDEPEPLIQRTFPFDDLSSIVELENLSEARTIAALYLADNWIKKHG